MAVLLNLTNWREDMQYAIVLTYLFGIFQFAKENSFTPLQTSTFLSIMKITIKKLNEERGQPPLKTLEKFKSLVLSNSSPIPGDDIFGPRESKLIIDFAMEGVFQHHKLYQYIASNDQESCLDFIGVEIQEPLVLPPPLSEAVTLEAHEAELARLNELKEQERLAKEEWEAEERAAAANPFEVLSPDAVKQIAADTVTTMLETICGELDGLLNEQSDRLMAQANKLTNLFAQ
ncbi:flagellar C1a complex subunit C1a-32-domain-containing protein [Obelidium mucronatum]|nr:flagellar C1a complex subunit C1a-32-domain-containing protein [Obelidium mucronatum]